MNTMKTEEVLRYELGDNKYLFVPTRSTLLSIELIRAKRGSTPHYEFDIDDDVEPVESIASNDLLHRAQKMYYLLNQGNITEAAKLSTGEIKLRQYHSKTVDALVHLFQNNESEQ